MKKIVAFSVFTIMMACFIPGPVSAQMILEFKGQTTMNIDAVWEKTPFIKNSLPKNEQDITCEGGGRFKIFVGKVKDIDVRMCRIDMPTIIGSQTTSIQITVNNHQQSSCPIKLSYQVFSEPKFIGDEIVVKAFIGMSNKTMAHFYLVVQADGNWYTTEVRKMVWKEN